MKKLFYLFLFLSLNLAMANGLENLKQLYANQKYQKVHSQATKYLRDNPLNLTANILLANSAYNLGNFDAAMAAYDRVLILDPNNIHAKIQEAKIYASSGYKDIALLEVDALLSQNLTKDEKNEALKLKNSLSATQKEDVKRDTALLKGLVNVGLLYDTNPNGDIGEKSFKLPGYNFNYQGKKPKDDFAHFQQLYITADKNIHNQIGVFATLNAYNRTYFDLGHNNLTYLFANIAPYYNLNEYKIFLPLIFNKVFLENDSHLNMYGAGVDLRKSLKNGVLEAGYRYYQNRYYGQDKDKNSHHHSLHVSTKYITFEDVLTHLTLRYAYNKERKDLRTDTNYNSYGIDFGANKKILQDLIFRAGAGFKYYEYRDFNSAFLSKRDDKVYNINLGLTYQITNSSLVEFDINYINKTSNQFVYEYDRILTSLNYSYRF